MENNGVRDVGSSPRMRGAPALMQTRQAMLRIIPADAGSTEPIAPNCRWKRDHPRGCGEHWIEQRGDNLYLGSSPRMRGARQNIVNWAKDVRIIPADAGSTRICGMYINEMGDHPRGCGEHPAIRPLKRVGMGSSPRMRGAHVFNIS